MERTEFAAGVDGGILAVGAHLAIGMILPSDAMAGERGRFLLTNGKVHIIQFIGTTALQLGLV